jgi:tetratricopeptide (TPR) repeat protein
MTGDQRLIAEALCDVGRMHAIRVEREPAVPLINEALVMFEGLGDKRGMAQCHEAIGVAYRGSPRDLDHYLLAVELFREIGADYDLASTLFSMAYRALIPNGRFDEARLALEESRGIFRRLGLSHGMLHVHTGLGQLARLRGDLDSARQLISETLEGTRDAGDRRCTVRMLTALARVALVEDGPRQACVLLDEALTVSVELDQGLSSDIHELIDSLALAAHRSGEHELAGRWFGAAESTRLRQGLLRAPPDQDVIDAALQDLEHEVGAERLRSLLDQGADLWLDDIAAELSHCALIQVSPAS